MSLSVALRATLFLVGGGLTSLREMSAYSKADEYKGFLGSFVTTFDLYDNRRENVIWLIIVIGFHQSEEKRQVKEIGKNVMEEENKKYDKEHSGF